jgi:acetyl esterase/lipase
MRSRPRLPSQLTVLATVGIALLVVPRFVFGQEGTFTQKTFTYKAVSDTEIQADVYRVDDDMARPIVVWIHGGALMMGSRRNPPQRLVDLCRVAGFVLVSIDYRTTVWHRP